MTETDATPSPAELATEAASKARQYELDYGSCPQCILRAVGEVLGGIDDATIKAAHGLAGGGALSGVGTCGAVTGGLLALSIRFGRDKDAMEKGRFLNNFKKGKALVDRFRARFGGITCAELQEQFTGRQFDLWQPAEFKAFDAARGSQCADATGAVAAWVTEEIAQAGGMR
ncbi:MAG: C-GCAxxG-C-C family protein [Magnetococcus sp. YQC-3]